MSLTKEERRAVVEFRIEKALRAYEQAKGVIGLIGKPLPTASIMQPTMLCLRF